LSSVVARALPLVRQHRGDGGAEAVLSNFVKGYETLPVRIPGYGVPRAIRRSSATRPLPQLKKKE
jgi:hypothetical protein